MKYMDESVSFEERALDLVSRMTLEEKISQTVYTAAAIEHLNIPSYNWWNEALHGVARAGTATVFPQAIGLAATFDDELLKDIADVISTEARAKYNAARKHGDRDIYKGLTFWSPNVNIFRDPRWGRGHETYGEDPYLTGRLGAAFVKGIQGDHPRYMKAAACAKHFAVHSGPENLRHEFDAAVSKKDLYETYLPAFKDCVDAGVESVMGAYNRTNGEPCCGSDTLLNQILRGEWGFKGHVVSDCWAIKDFHDHHHVTKTAPESIAMAINNGCDLNCGNMYLNLMIAVNEGLVSEETITRAVVRLMITRMKLGMFDAEENVCFNTIGYDRLDTAENAGLNLEAAKQSLVLLKNNGLLPLERDKIKHIAVIGPNADSRIALEGNYQGTASKYITLLEGIRETLGAGTKLYYSEGCHLYKENISGLSGGYGDRLSEASAAAEAADLSIVCLGLDSTIEGEEGDASNEFSSGDKKELKFPGLQEELLKRVVAAGKPVILVIMAGSAMDLSWAEQNVDAIIQAWYPGAQGGAALSSLIFGEYSPSGRLPVTVYRSIDDLPEFTDYNMANRTYRYMETEALYPFGFGLSYTSFDYSGLEIDSSGFDSDGVVYVRVKIKNTGSRAGKEIAQLYITDVEASVSVPHRSLRGFKPLCLRQGETREIEFRLTKEDFSIFNNDGASVFEPGVFEIYAGGSQPDARSVELTGKTPLSGRIEL